MKRTDGNTYGSNTHGTKADVTGIKRPQRDSIQTEPRQRLHESRGHGGGRIADNTKRKGKGYRNHEATGGVRFADNTKRERRQRL